MSFPGGYTPKVGGTLQQTIQKRSIANHLAGGDSGSELGKDFPFVCEVCLGPNQFVRMMKLPFGTEQCRISELPMQAFRWKAGGGRFKKTVISFDVAKAKNVCQACVTDMSFGVPVAVRDSLLQSGGGYEAQQPQSEVGKQWYFANNLGNGQGNGGEVNPNQQLVQLSRSLQSRERQNARSLQTGMNVAFRNLAKLCSFWLNGSCNRVVQGRCPFRPCNKQYKFPELASSHPDMSAKLIEVLKKDGPVKVMRTLDVETRRLLHDSTKGNKEIAIRNRYNGVQDDVSRKYLARAQSQFALEKPEDQSITALWLGGIDANMITQADITDKFYQYGEIASINIIPHQGCAFVQYVDRQGAEKAADEVYKNLTIRGLPIVVKWAKPIAKATNDDDDERDGKRQKTETPAALPPPPGHAPGMQTLPPPPAALQHFIPPPPPPKMSDVPPPPPPGPQQSNKRKAPAPTSYPSMQMDRMGSKAK